jgi:dTDP-4-amino-4,6-dideoxygalactose transaminase
VKQIPVYKPWLGDAEQAAAREALELGWLGMGSYVGQFEERLKALTEADDRYVAAVSTGHAALHLSLLLAGVGPGDEVITPSFNNIADLQAIIATGAEPVFVDIDDDTLCLDVAQVRDAVSPRTKAIIAMDYACHIADHEAVGAIALEHGLRVIHDAAHALGSRHGNRAIGSFSDIAMFSFDPVKTITCIDGGAIIVKTKEELAALHEMRLIGMKQAATMMYGNQRAWNYDVERPGFRYHLANMHAAIGLAQLSKWDAIASTRVDLFHAYRSALGDLPAFRVPSKPRDPFVPFMFYLRVLNGRRTEFREHLTLHGIDTGIHWQPAHWFTLFKTARKMDLSVTDRVGEEVLTIPFHSNMDPGDRDRVIEAVRAFK